MCYVLIDYRMKSKNLIAFLAVSALICASCRREPVMRGEQSRAKLSVTIDAEGGAKSSLTYDENKLKDLNIWVYSSSGELKESHYFDDLSISGSGSVGFETSAGGHSRLVLVGNAGRALTAPSDWNTRTSYPFAIGGSGRVLMAGEGALSLNATGMESHITLFRVFSRISLSVELSSALRSAGGVLGGNVRIGGARLCNCPGQFSIQPSDAYASMRSFKADASTPLSNGDYLSSSDISTLYSGGIVKLYSLPNYTDMAYSDRPVSDTEYSTYLEMQVKTDPLGNAGEGSFFCRFYANDGARIGLQGGCSYHCRIVLSNDGAEHYWRKEDFRFEVPDAMLAGTVNEVNLLNGNLDPGRVTFSLADTPGVNSDGVFRLEGKVLSGGLCTGVTVVPERSGSGTLYAFDADGSRMASVPLNSVYPTINASVANLDVTGTEAGIMLSGLSYCHEHRASDELFSSLYSVASISETDPVDGLYASDFMSVDQDAMQMYVSSLVWHRNMVEHNWQEAVGKRFPFKLTLNCGISCEFNANVSNALVGRFASSAYYGDVINTSEVPYPKAAVQALDGRNITIERRGVALPSGFAADWAEGKWSSWYGGDAIYAGNQADSYATLLSDGLRWNFGSSVTQTLYGADIPVYIGCVNKWSGDYVRVSVGTYSSSKYIPAGLEYGFYQIGFDSWGNVNMGNTGMEVYSLLIFREHDANSSISSTDCKSGDQPGMVGGPRMFLESDGTAYFTDRGRKAYVISYSGDLWDMFDPSAHLDGTTRNISLSSAMANSATWASESEDSHSPKTYYASPAFGGTGSSNIWLYLYCPYVSSGVYIADANGRVSAKGELPVHLWSVSTKAVFDYYPGGDWITNGEFTPPWR